jgi:hypothetical protein
MTFNRFHKNSRQRAQVEQNNNSLSALSRASQGIDRFESQIHAEITLILRWILGVEFVYLPGFFSYVLTPKMSKNY